MSMLQRINIKKRLNLIIHTEGGESCCADAISYLFTNQNLDVHTNVPQYAQSAGTMLALCGKKIIVIELIAYSVPLTHNLNMSREEMMTN